MKTDLEKAQDAIDKLLQKLAVATREKAVADKNVRTAASAAVTNNKARASLEGLNKASDAAQRTIRSVETELKDAKTRLSQVQNSIAVSSAASAAAAAAHLPPGTRLFQVTTPDMRKVRHRHRSAEDLQRTLLPGYVVTGEAFGSAADGTGGVVAATDGTVPSLMASLLRSHGKELIAYIEGNGFERNGGAA
jgi:hypothetical protein